MFQKQLHRIARPLQEMQRVIMHELDDYYVQPSNKEAEVNILIKKLRVPSIDYNSVK